MPIDTINDCDCNYIKETICKIDKLQKEVITVGETRCISCDASLFSSANNTIPVALYTECGSAFTGATGLDGATTPFFRIESIRCGRFATLRMLTIETGETPTLTATNRTMIIDLDRVAAMQCHEPIYVEVCSTSTPV